MTAETPIDVRYQAGRQTVLLALDASEYACLIEAHPGGPPLHHTGGDGSSSLYAIRIVIEEAMPGANAVWARYFSAHSRRQDVGRLSKLPPYGRPDCQSVVGRPWRVSDPTQSRHRHRQRGVAQVGEWRRESARQWDDAAEEAMMLDRVERLPSPAEAMMLRVSAQTSQPAGCLPKAATRMR
jgi:hypothetical protein